MFALFGVKAEVGAALIAGETMFFGWVDVRGGGVGHAVQLLCSGLSNTLTWLGGGGKALRLSGRRIWFGK